MSPDPGTPTIKCTYCDAVLNDRSFSPRFCSEMCARAHDATDRPFNIPVDKPGRLVPKEGYLEMEIERRALGMVVIESPLLDMLPAAITYARLALLDCYRRHEIPQASHLIGPQVLDDKLEDDREIGIAAGWLPYELGARAVVYVDLGITRGMQRGIEYAQKRGRKVECRAFGRPIIKPVYLSRSYEGSRFYGEDSTPEAIRALFAKFGPAQPCNWP